MRNYSETRLHIASVHYLRGEVKHGRTILKVQKPFDVLFLHPVNEFKDEKEAFWGKAKGIYPGCADLLFFWPTSKGAIELKVDSKQSSNQRDFEAHWRDMGGYYAICKTVASVRDTLKSWGLVCKNEQAIEPRLSDEQLLAMQSEIYKR